MPTVDRTQKSNFVFSVSQKRALPSWKTVVPIICLVTKVAFNVAALGSTAEDQRLQSWLYNVKKLIKVANIIPGGLNRTATVTCENPHGLLVEDTVTIYGANPAVYNGTFEVTARLDEFTFSI